MNRITNTDTQKINWDRSGQEARALPTVSVYLPNLLILKDYPNYDRNTFKRRLFNINNDGVLPKFSYIR